jgi:predicted nucleic acid-binding protein
MPQFRAEVEIDTDTVDPDTPPQHLTGTFVSQKVTILLSPEQALPHRILHEVHGADTFNVLLLRAESDNGEAEALIQALEKQALFFIGDERRAGAIATFMGRTAVGTLRLLARLHLEGRTPELRGLVRMSRRDLDFRVSDEIVQQAIDLAAEPI